MSFREENKLLKEQNAQLKAEKLEALEQAKVFQLLAEKTSGDAAVEIARLVKVITLFDNELKKII